MNLVRNFNKIFKDYQIDFLFNLTLICVFLFSQNFLEEDIWEVERTELDFTMALLKGETVAFHKRTQDHITRTIAQCNRLDGALRCFKEAHTFIKRVLLEIDPKHEHQVRVHANASLVACALPGI